MRPFLFSNAPGWSFAGALDDDTLAARLNAEPQVLCIVSTRKQAQAVYAKLNGEGVYHLSTLMVPAHRRQILTEIRQRLKAGLPCRVVSTSLVEAGVDVDFPVVYRAEAGLDSLIQACGALQTARVNRPLSPVYVFKPEAQYKLPDTLEMPAGVMRSVTPLFDDAMSFDAIEAYFNELYDVKGDGADTKSIVKRLEQNAAPKSSLRGDCQRLFAHRENTRPLVVPYDEAAEKLIAQLRTNKPTRELLRAIQPYTVSVYPQHFKALRDGGWLEMVGEELAVLTDRDKYSDATGLEASSDSGRGYFTKTL